MNFLQNTKNLAKRMFPSWYAEYVGYQKRKYAKHAWYEKERMLERVAKILESPEEPCCYDSEVVFSSLQNGPPPSLKYGYDPFSTWKRGTERAVDLLCKTKLHEPGVCVLEAACGDGMTGYALMGFGHRVTLLDLEDWRDARARNMTFVPGDMCTTVPFERESFDLIFSYNAFEHVADPSAALRELSRVCKKGGYIYLNFNPLYNSSWGLHAWRTLHMPYPQFLFSEIFLQAKLDKLGIEDLGKKMTSLQPLNRWSLSQFKHLWRNCTFEVVLYRETADDSYVNLIDEFPQAFTGRGLTLYDLTVYGIEVMLKK